MKITEHVTLDEIISSPKAEEIGIENTPTTQQLKNFIAICVRVFEPLRASYGKPIKINSAFRCEALNNAIKGAKNSQHLGNNGAALDLSAGSKKENEILFNILKDLGTFDQLIDEYDYSWVHVSYVSEYQNRKQILRIK